MTIDITTNPWHAVNHFREAAHLGPSDRIAAETLWRRLRKAQKRAKRLEMVVDKANERERVLKERIRDLEAAAQAVVERWDSPTWKDLPPTAKVIGRLRDVLAGRHVGDEE